jgi:hypothetical protein
MLKNVKLGLLVSLCNHAHHTTYQLCPNVAFYFNADGAILGKIIPDVNDMSSDSALPYLDFLATKLLPCGPADGDMQKFTGNEDNSPAPDAQDELTMAIHAFGHFSSVYSKGDLLLCDLQGKYLWHSVVLPSC